jgi:hypothetical protein
MVVRAAIANRTTKEDIMKTTSFALLALLTCSTYALAQSAPQAPGWHERSETNAADSYKYTNYMLAGEYASQSATGAAPTLVVSCVPATDSGRGKFLSANLVAGMPLKIDMVEPEEIHGMNYFPKVKVEYRADGGSQHVNWSPGTDKASATIPKEDLRRLLRAHSVAIDARDAQGADVAMRFDMPDSASIRAACSL